MVAQVRMRSLRIPQFCVNQWEVEWPAATQPRVHAALSPSSSITHREAPEKTAAWIWVFPWGGGGGGLQVIHKFLGTFLFSNNFGFSGKKGERVHQIQNILDFFLVIYDTKSTPKL